MPALPATVDQAPVTMQAATVVRADARSGRLVRSVVVESVPVEARAVQPRAIAGPDIAAQEAARLNPPPVQTVAQPLDLGAMVNRIASEQGVEESLVHSVIRAESNYNPLAVSPKGAQGMMQLIPATARRFGVAHPFDPEENIQGGVKYLKFLLDYYHGNYPKAIAAYNAGESAVDRYNGIPPYPETRNYVFRVARNLREARLEKDRVAAQRPASVPEPETYRPIRASVGDDGRVYYRTP